MKDYYRILGVSEQAAEKEIKAAYRKLAKQYHPDVVQDDAEKTQRMYEIQEAYECLGDEESRKEYDKAGTAHKYCRSCASSFRGPLSKGCLLLRAALFL